VALDQPEVWYAYVDGDLVELQAVEDRISLVVLATAEQLKADEDEALA
jgi:hypothetical protein